MIHFYRYIFRKRFSEMMFLSFSRCQRLLKNRQKLCLYSYSLIAIRTGLFVIFCIRMYTYPNIFPKNSGISEKNLHNLVMRISSLIANFKANQIKRSLRCHVFTIVQQWALRPHWRGGCHILEIFTCFCARCKDRCRELYRMDHLLLLLLFA